MKKIALRKTAGSLSAGTRVVVLEEGETWADVQTLNEMPHVPLAGTGFSFAGSLDGRPIISAIRKNYLVELRPNR